MKKLIIIILIAVITVTVQCTAQEIDTTWYENEYRNPDIENVESIISMMDSLFPLEHVGTIRNSIASWKRLKHIEFSRSDRIRNIDTNPFRVGTVALAENGGMRNATFTEELLFLIQDYEEDCYNDSSYIGIYQYYDTKLPTKLTSIIVDTFPIYRVPILVKGWYHKEPTFKGFSEWLKDKGHK